MSEASFRGVRLRLTAFYALASAGGLGALVALGVHSKDVSEHERLDRAVERQTIHAGGWSYDIGHDHLKIDRSDDGPFAPRPHNEVPVVVVNPAGRIEAGPRDLLDVAAAQRAFDRARRAGDHVLYTDTVAGARSRVGATPSVGSTHVLAAVVAAWP